MNSINEELTTCLNNIATKYGVVISTLNVCWTDVSHMNREEYIVRSIETVDSRFIKPLNKEL